MKIWNQCEMELFVPRSSYLWCMPLILIMTLLIIFVYCNSCSLLESQEVRDSAIFLISVQFCFICLTLLPKLLFSRLNHCSVIRSISICLPIRCCMAISHGLPSNIWLSSPQCASRSSLMYGHSSVMWLSRSLIWQNTPMREGPILS